MRAGDSRKEGSLLSHLAREMLRAFSREGIPQSIADFLASSLVENHSSPCKDMLMALEESSRSKTFSSQLLPVRGYNDLRFVVAVYRKPDQPKGGSTLWSGFEDTSIDTRQEVELSQQVSLAMMEFANCLQGIPATQSNRNESFASSLIERDESNLKVFLKGV